MRVFVTGGTGFIGRNLCARLAADGHEITVLSRQGVENENEPREKESIPCHFVKGDLSDFERVSAAVTACRPDVVFHLASERSQGASYDGDVSVIRANSVGTFNLLQACAPMPQAPTVVYASAMGVYNYETPVYLPVDEMHPIQPVDVYGLSKVMGEESCKFFASKWNLPCAVLRISGVFGPGKPQGLVYGCLQSVRTGTVVKLAGGDVVRDLVYVSDVVDAILQAVARATPGDPAVYNIGSGQGSSLLDVVGAAERVSGARVRREFLSGTQTSRFYFDIGKAKAELGFNPLTLDQGTALLWRALSLESAPGLQ